MAEQANEEMSFLPNRSLQDYKTDSSSQAVVDDNENDCTASASPINPHCTALPICSVIIYLVTWVANGEMMQEIESASLEPFDRPAFLSWSAYNMLLLSWIPFVLCCGSPASARDFIHYTWAGSAGYKYMLSWSCAMQFVLLTLNIFWAIGLANVSVAMSNAIYQLQAAATIGLSVWWLGSRFVAAEAVGIAVSLLGVSLIVVPPLLASDTRHEDKEDGATSREQDMILGVIVTLLSAVIWAFYQVAWRIIFRGKEQLSRLDGLLDTLATLGVMGAINLTIGWLVLVLLHWTGFETFEWPSHNMMPVLLLNGLVEYAFDASCAVAIYLTSPVVTAMTAPLTIPVSFVWDHVLYGSPLQLYSWNWIGSLMVLLGIAWMELKIPCNVFVSKFLHWRTCQPPYSELAVREM